MSSKIRLRNRLRAGVLGLAFCIAPAGLLGQDAPRRVEPGNSWDRPTDLGVRFTPSLARAISNAYTKEVMVKRYDLPTEQADKVSEVVARRLMETAHGSEKPAQELVEFVLTQAFNFSADMSEGKSFDSIPPQFGQGFGERVMPVLPAIRELIKNVGQDVRPMLPVKQQLKLGADLMAAHASIDAFEKVMQRWSKGQVNPFEDPFGGDESEQIKKDEHGESDAFKQAKQRAEENVKSKARVSKWREYVERAKKLYGLNESQMATADSILREVSARAEALSGNEDWRGQAYRNRLWASMCWQLPMGWRNPLRECIEDNYQGLSEPLDTLGEELKRRIDDIPTAAQRQQAEREIAAALADHGFEPQTRPESQPY